MRHFRAFFWTHTIIPLIDNSRLLTVLRRTANGKREKTALTPSCVDRSVYRPDSNLGQRVYICWRGGGSYQPLLADRLAVGRRGQRPNLLRPPDRSQVSAA